MKSNHISILLLVGILAINHQVFATSDGQVSDDLSKQEDYYEDQSTGLINNLDPESDGYWLHITGYDYENTQLNLTDNSNKTTPVLTSTQKVPLSSSTNTTPEFIGIDNSDLGDLADGELSEEISQNLDDKSENETTSRVVVVNDDVSVENLVTQSVKVFAVNSDVTTDEFKEETTQTSVIFDEVDDLLGSGDSSDIIRLDDDDDETTTSEPITDKNTTDGSQCQDDEFSCDSNSKCLNSTRKCDSVFDCDDRSDEELCQYTTS